MAMFLAKKAVLVGVAALGLSLAGCKSGNEKAADKNLGDMKSANTATASTNVGEKTLPPECEAYVTKVDSCLKKVGSNPAAGAFRQSMEQTRASWNNIQDKVALANACKQADASFDQVSAQLNCK